MSRTFEIMRELRRLREAGKEYGTEATNLRAERGRLLQAERMAQPPELRATILLAHWEASPWHYRTPEQDRAVRAYIEGAAGPIEALALAGLAP